MFRAYTSIVLSGQGRKQLYDVWKQQQPPAGIKLSEEDYTNLAVALALRTPHPEERVILGEQLGRIHDKDRQERLLFLMPALSGDAGDRDRFFESLEDARIRKKEAWVLMGLSYLHHPLRTAMSEKYLAPSLDMLEDIQRTGDVFLPQGWLQTSLSWYQTKTAAALVRGFLESHPGYNTRLRAKILQSADNLFRAEQLIK